MILRGIPEHAYRALQFFKVQTLICLQIEGFQFLLLQKLPRHDKGEVWF
jgi:hypothetical protein